MTRPFVRPLVRPFVVALAGVSLATAQSWQMGVSVRSSALSVNCSGGAQTAALPLGPVTAPVSANLSRGGANAWSSVTPPAAGGSWAIGFGASAFGDITCSFTTALASASLGLDLVVSSPNPGPHWLRVLWDGSNWGSGIWTLNGPGGFVWREIRGTILPGHPVYVDVPVDLTQPAMFRLEFGVSCQGWISCGPSGCTYHNSSAGGTMTFALRSATPMQQEIYGAPCSSRTGYFPAAAAYDPFGVPGLTQIEVGCSNFMNAPFLVLCLGSSRDRLGTVPLPLDLTPFGAPGCSLLTDLVVLIPVPPVGRYPTVLLGPDTALRGMGPVYCQWLAGDSVNALGLIVSNGVRIELP